MSEVQEEIIEFHEGGQRLEAKAFVPAGKAPRAGVLVAHTWAGRGEFECGQARALAELGYVGFAADVFGDGRVGASPEENRANLDRMLEDRDLLFRRLRANLDAMRAMSSVDAGATAAVGYCFGGLCVLDMARGGLDVRGVVGFHGLVDPAPPATEAGSGRAIEAKVLLCNGARDPWVPRDKLSALEDELSAAGADWQIHQYGDAMHAFTNPSADSPGSGALYDEAAARRAWRSMTDFLADLFD